MGGRGALEHWTFQEAKMRECRPFIPLILQTPVQFSSVVQFKNARFRKQARSESAIGVLRNVVGMCKSEADRPLDLTNPFSSVVQFNNARFQKRVVGEYSIV